MRDRLAVRDLRLADVRVDVELAHHPVDEHLEVELAHAGDDRLAGVQVGVHHERRVFVGERVERLAELVLVVLGLRLDRDGDHRGRELHPLEDDRVRAVAERVTGGGLLEAEAGDDVAGVRDVDVFALVGVHAQDATDALLAVLGGVVDLRALLERARVDAEVRELAVGVGDDLERERGERLVLAGLALDRLLALHVGALRRRDVERRRQVVDDGVEHGLHALVLERRAAQHRHELELERAEPERVLDLGDRDLLVGEVLLEQRVVDVRDGLEQLVARGCRPRPGTRRGCRRSRTSRLRCRR